VNEHQLTLLTFTAKPLCIQQLPLVNSTLRLGSLNQVRSSTQKTKFFYLLKSFFRSSNATPLFLAAQNGKADIVRLCADNGADLNAAISNVHYIVIRKHHFKLLPRKVTRMSSQRSLVTE
jgi:ankyrin repeat protein